jgi:hypothetical protein
LQGAEPIAADARWRRRMVRRRTADAARGDCASATEGRRMKLSNSAVDSPGNVR